MQLWITGGPQRPSRRGGVRQEGDLCAQTAQAPQRGWMLWQQVSRNEIEYFLYHILGVKARGSSYFWNISGKDTMQQFMDSHETLETQYYLVYYVPF